MLNHIWLGMLLTAALVACLTGNVRPAVDGAIRAAETAVTLAFGLIGVMALWLGIMRLAERSGLVTVIARRAAAGDDPACFPRCRWSTRPWRRW
jgi:spore maturation protein A